MSDKKLESRSIFIFRRDFRLYDNVSFIECYKNSDIVIPIFIFTPEQIDKKLNPYFSNNGFQFMIESLEELNQELKDKYNSKIHYFNGDNVDILKKIYKEFQYTNIYFNKDYTLYAQERDNKIKDYCEKKNILLNVYEDYLLNPIGTYLKEDGTPYEVYGPFKKNARKIKVPKPSNFQFDPKQNKFGKIKSTLNPESSLLKEINPNLLVYGGRENALKILKNMRKFSFYANERNNLIQPTTLLSAYIKFGCVSIREVYQTVVQLFGIEHGIIDQLYWREFYFYLAFYIPRVLQGKSLKEKYDGIQWENNPKNIEAWMKGETGFPAVDAGMRQLNSTGYMHNRARLITSGILIKILNVDWRIGEKYFATQLIDYDPCVNNGNWQWSSGSGADSQPYFRILSPWKQAKDNDPDCEYIKKWIPELRDIPVKDILNWDKTSSKYKSIKYPSPIVDYEKMRKDIMDVYKTGFGY
jgi:deoxyribodipyrimidine photo-lyase